ncbi:MAG: hypothetical protein KIT60_20355 [Burkholderiaceae bacterium]|nr:hypothetical protein [Burkholderiaceae bacterium]
MRTVARGLIGVLFTVQMAVAAHVCPTSLRLHSQADLQDESSEAHAPAAMADAASCHAGAPLDPDAPNLCAEHCKYGQQIDVSKPSVPAAVLAALYLTPPVPETAVRPRPAPATISALVAAAPPHAILHCVYRI